MISFCSFLVLFLIFVFASTPLTQMNYSDKLCDIVMHFKLNNFILKITSLVILIPNLYNFKSIYMRGNDKLCYQLAGLFM